MIGQGTPTLVLRFQHSTENHCVLLHGKNCLQHVAQFVIVLDYLIIFVIGKFEISFRAKKSRKVSRIHSQKHYGATSESAK